MSVRFFGSIQKISRKLHGQNCIFLLKKNENSTYVCRLSSGSFSITSNFTPPNTCVDFWLFDLDFEKLQTLRLQTHVCPFPRLFVLGKAQNPTVSATCLVAFAQISKFS
jgi:hypothetical protein